jgi:hypothetical protein
MWRHLLAVAAVLVGGLAVGQDKRPSAAEQKEMQRKQAEAYLKKYPTEVPDLLDLAEKSGEKVADLLAAAKVSDDDKPAVRAAKRALLAEIRRRELIQTRIVAGQFTGGASYIQLTDTSVGFYQAATLIWTDPEKLLPFAESMAAALLSAELFNVPRVEQGLEEPQLGPQLQAARYKAEVTVLKLREEVKAKKK